MSFDQIALTLLIGGWAICGMFPWLAASVLTRGNAGLWFLPASMFVAVLFAMLVPFLGGTGVGGLWLSFLVAFIAPALLLSARRFALQAPTARPAPTPRVPAGETRPSE